MTTILFKSHNIGAHVSVEGLGEISHREFFIAPKHAYGTFDLSATLNKAFEKVYGQGFHVRMVSSPNHVEISSDMEEASVECDVWHMHVLIGAARLVFKPLKSV